MITTFTPVLKKKNKEDDFGIINIRVIQNRKSKYFSLKIQIKEKSWNKKYRQVKPTHPEHEEINTIIESEIKQIKKKFIESNETSSIKEEEKKKTDKSFLNLFSNHKDFLLDRNRIGTYKCYHTAYLHLEKYIKSIGKKDLFIDEVDGLFIRNFETYLLSKVSMNSCNKYLSTLKKVYKEGIILDIVPSTKKDPFLLWENKREKIQKPYLVKPEVERILFSHLDESHPLFDTRNFFLFQIFAQGLRISDLLTLRWENFDFKTRSFNFLQQKTKKKHRLFLTHLNMGILKDYVPECKELYATKKFNLKVGNNSIPHTIEEAKSIYRDIRKKNLSKFLSGDKIAIEKINKWISFIHKNEETLYILSINLINEYSKKHKKDFVFPILDNSDFAEIDFQRSVNLNKYLFNQIGSKTALYNKRLKELQKLFELETPLTSHLARHTYTNLMIENTENDILAISKSLGHQRLSTTQHYVSEFSIERTENANDQLANKFL